MNTIINYNNKGQLHGYYKRYDNNIITIRTIMKNNKPIGYEEYHRYKITRFNIK
jgi:hypothetical protein